MNISEWWEGALNGRAEKPRGWISKVIYADEEVGKRRRCWGWECRSKCAMHSRRGRRGRRCSISHVLVRVPDARELQPI